MVDAASLKASAEGDADMDNVPRLSRSLVRLLLGVVVLLVLISLPVLRTERTPGSVLTPRIAWAGGSPDETLNPKHSSTLIVTDPEETRAIRASNTPVSDRKALRQWEIYYRVFRIFAQRLI
jgi:hypothetical protein